MMTPLTTSKPRLEVLTSLRFFAAALVVLTHWNCGTFQTDPVWLRAFVTNGYWAVSFFFALSGFVLAYTYHDPASPTGLKGTRTGFWVARVARIWPVYLLALLVSLPLFIYSVLVSKINTAGVFWGGLVSVPFLLQAWIPSFAIAWNTPAWSLSVEALFYTAFPFLIGPLSRRSPRLLMFGSLLLVCLTATARYFLYPSPNLGLFASPGQQLRFNFFAYFPLWHLPTFVFGVALGRFYLCNRDQPWRRANFFFLLGGGAVIAIFMLRPIVPALLRSDLIFMPLYALVIYGAAHSCGMINRIFSQGWLVRLGEASYSVYLFHGPLGIFFFRCVRLFTPVSAIPSHVCLAAYFLFVIFFCLVVYENFEKPFRRRVADRLNRRFQPCAPAS